MSTSDYNWEPAYGFAPFYTATNVGMAYSLEAIRRRLCAYRAVGDQTCDCKYGVTMNGSGTSEATGCCELREMIDRLLHRPETFSGDIDSVEAAWINKMKGYDLALKHVQANLDQLTQPDNFARTL